MAKVRSSMPGGAAGATTGGSDAAALAAGATGMVEAGASDVVDRAGCIGLVAPSRAYVQSQARHSAAGGRSRSWRGADGVGARLGAGVGRRSGAGGATSAGGAPEWAGGDSAARQRRISSAASNAGSPTAAARSSGAMGIASRNVAGRASPAWEPDPVGTRLAGLSARTEGSRVAA